jgi:predicted TIM-barrel fold metal-dependent hydrolase
MTVPARCTGPDRNPKIPINFTPKGACDCHFHVFDGPSVQVADRSYSAPSAPLSADRNVQKKLSLDRAVIVQPSVYGTDNSTTMAAVTDKSQMKAVVVVPDDVTSKDLKNLNKAGAVGTRLNLLFTGGGRRQDLISSASKLADFDWHMQVLADVSQAEELMPALQKLPVPIVFDHFGHSASELGVNNTGFQSLLRMVDDGKTWVKLSAPYRISKMPNFEDADPFAKALLDVCPDRLVWGSDWPHPSFLGGMPNDADLFDILFNWVGSANAAKILVENPEKLYGFQKAGT